MKRCLSCAESFAGSDWRCPRCGWAPLGENALLLFAPDSAEREGGFDPSSFARLAVTEEANFWFRARNSLLVWSLGKYGRDVRAFLEVGCGTGYVLQGLSGAHQGIRFVGGELFREALAHAATRVPGLQLLQFDARQIPFEEEFDAVGAFDVLEHVEEDEAVLRELHRAAKPGGMLMITVPQHPLLWSDTDSRSHHARRYTRSDIEAKIETSGFAIVRSTSFNSFLMPLMIVARKLKRRARWQPVIPDELAIGKRLGGFLGFWMRLEVALIRWGVSFPWGGSRLIVALKANREERA